MKFQNVVKDMYGGLNEPLLSSTAVLLVAAPLRVSGQSAIRTCHNQAAGRFPSSSLVAELPKADDRDVEIQPGSEVEVTTSSGERVPMRALGGPSEGRDFLVVRVCTESDWQAGRGEAEAIPWPAQYVHSGGPIS
jgi:hypothetical protein